ncbi:MAG TPA: AsmA-like C-terminal region-containing protein, partial [Bacteroidia bacterium]|nr:AsmA-like C-terminal region-containing protein [Bacteroidia bacterium]
MKALKITGLILAIVICAIILIPIIFKNKIAEAAKTQINQSLLATVNFSDFDLHLIRSFPNLTFQINDLSVVGTDVFKNDTIIYAQTLAVKLSIWEVLCSSNYKIQSFELENALLNIKILPNGQANYNIVKPDSSSASESDASAFKLALKKYSINHSNINYNDAQSHIYVSIENVNHKGSGDFTQDVVNLITQTEIEKMSVTMDKINYLNRVKTKAAATFNIDMKAGKYTFVKNSISLNDLMMHFDGSLTLAENNIYADLTWGIDKNDLKSFMSLIPNVYQNNFSNLTCSGNLAAKGFIKGNYNANQIPAFDFSLKIDNGRFKYSQLPNEVKNINVDFVAINNSGIENETIINLKKFEANLGGDAISARLKITTPVLQPYLDAALKGTINLSNFKSFMPLAKDESLSGIVSADITANGYYTDIEKSAYQKFNAAGYIQVNDLKYNSQALTQATTINRLKLVFNPQTAILEYADMQFGESDFKAQGQLSNFWGYYLNNQMLSGKLQVQSQKINLNQFAGNTANDTATQSSTGIIEVPANLHFELLANAGNCTYNQINISDFAGSIKIANQTVQLNQASFKTLDGVVNMSGSYSTQNIDAPNISYKLDLKQIDIKAACKTFNEIETMAPIAAYVHGKVSSQFNVIGALDANMQPVLKTLTGWGSLSTHQLGTSNMPLLNEVANSLKMPVLNNPTIGDVTLAFKFVDGRLLVDPYSMKLNDYKASISGSNGFDKTINYFLKLEVPKSKIPASAMATVTNLLQKANAQLNTQLTLPDPVPIDIEIIGNILKPQIKTQLAQTGKNMATTLTDAATTKAKEEARKQADKLLAEAELKA